MAKIKKKNIKMIMVFINIGIAAVKDYKMTFNSLDFEILLSGLRTLNYLIV